MEGKWYLSLSFWLNILTALVAIANALFDFGEFESAPWVPGVVVTVIALVNLIKYFLGEKKLVLGFRL